MPRTHACIRARKRTSNFALWCETMPRTRRPAPLAAARRALRYMMCESVNGDLIVAFQGKPLHPLIPSGKAVCVRPLRAHRVRRGPVRPLRRRAGTYSLGDTLVDLRMSPTSDLLVDGAGLEGEVPTAAWAQKRTLGTVSTARAMLSTRPPAGSHRLRRARGDDTAAAVCACAAVDQRRHARQAPVFLRAFDGRRSRRTRRSAARDAGNGLSP